MKTAIRILLADDHALVREGFKQLFTLTATDIIVHAEATNGAEVLEMLQSKTFDLILLDMNMPGISGPDLIVRIQARDDAPPILVLSMYNELQIARRALAAGAAGYLTKDNNPEVLLSAVRKVAAGGRFIDPALAEAMAFESSPTGKPHSIHELLSDREREIYLLLAKGVSVNEIAGDLAISNKTVSTHKARLMEKMGFANNADMVRHAVANGLLV